MPGTDLRRMILWVIFGSSIFFLFDKWQIYTGHTSLLIAQRPAETAPGKAVGGDAAAGTGGAASGVPVVAGGSAVAPGLAAPVGAASAADAAPLVIENDVLRLYISPLGGEVVRAEMLQQLPTLDWKQAGIMALIKGGKAPGPADEAPLMLLDAKGSLQYSAQSGVIGVDGAPNHHSTFTPVEVPARWAAGQDQASLTLAAEGGGLKVRQTYVLQRGSYDVEVRQEVTNASEAAVKPSVYVQLVRGSGPPPPGSDSSSRSYTGPAVYTSSGKFEKVSFSDVDKGKASFVKDASDGWVAMLQHYFVAAWIPGTGAQRSNYVDLDPGYTDHTAGHYRVGSILPLGPVAPSATARSVEHLYLGPEDQNALAKVSPGLDLVVDYGWLSPIAKPLFWLLQFFHGLVSNWGWAIILLTVAVKLVFFPLQAASYRSMAKMKELTPRMQRIREQYADDKQKQQMAMMEMYKTEKINPLGSCLPIFIQMPVFIALYWVLLGSVEMRHAPWVMWVKDLAGPDPWFILPALMMITMWVQFKLNPTPPDPVQAKVMAIMPLVFGAMMFFFPSGLVLYWTVSNLLSIGQQWLITRQFAAKAAA